MLVHNSPTVLPLVAVVPTTGEGATVLQTTTPFVPRGARFDVIPLMTECIQTALGLG